MMKQILKFDSFDVEHEGGILGLSRDEFSVDSLTITESGEKCHIIYQLLKSRIQIFILNEFKNDRLRSQKR